MIASTKGVSFQMLRVSAYSWEMAGSRSLMKIFRKSECAIRQDYLHQSEVGSWMALRVPGSFKNGMKPDLVPSATSSRRTRMEMHTVSVRHTTSIGSGQMRWRSRVAYKPIQLKTRYNTTCAFSNLIYDKIEYDQLVSSSPPDTRVSGCQIRYLLTISISGALHSGV